MRESSGMMHPQSGHTAQPACDGWTQEPNNLRRQAGSARTRTEDSWIDIASHSSSSFRETSNNEIVTTGLQLRRSEIGHPRDSHMQPAAQTILRSYSVAGSSQDEYEESESESESESDRVLSSSNEDASKSRSDEDETLTTLGLGSDNSAGFKPQPNAFSYPPNSEHNIIVSGSQQLSYPTRVTYSDRLPSNRMITQRTIIQRQLSREQISVSRSHTDHDEALRASLTTLLSCAAAVRPKNPVHVSSAARTNRHQTFRLVTGSEIGVSPDHAPRVAPKYKLRESSKERQAKKMRAIRATTVGEDSVSPTVMTWMISAGVVLVVSAISFSAGYAWGKDVGRIEGGLGCSGCGRDTIRAGSGGLRKLRWSSAAQSVCV